MSKFFPNLSHVDSEEEQMIQYIVDLLHAQTDYQVINKQIGKGSFGSVMTVQKKSSSCQQYAIKHIRLSDENGNLSTKKQENALNESQIHQQLSHVNVVQFHESFQIDKSFFIVMHKCEKSLEDYLKNHNLSDQEFFQIAEKIIEGITYLYTKDILIRDIKLDNILLDQQGTIKLCDFGLSKKIDYILSSKVFKTYHPKGTLFYMAPELYKVMNKEQQIYQSFESDIWSYGIALYFMAGAQITDVINLLINGIYTAVKGNEVIDQVLRQILKINPVDRPTTQEIKQILKLAKASYNGINNFNQNLIINVDNNQTTLYEDTHKAMILYHLGIQFLNNKDYKNSEQYLNQCIQLDNQMIKAKFYLGLLHYEQSNLLDAALLFQQILNIDESDADAKFYLDIILNNGQSEELNLLFQVDKRKIQSGLRMLKNAFQFLEQS